MVAKRPLFTQSLSLHFFLPKSFTAAYRSTFAMQLKQLGPYEIHEALGRGGMGTVFRGVHLETSENVALKVLAPAFATDSGFRERFEAEIKSLEKLSHPNIVSLKGYGEQEGVLYYAMELVSGSSLQAELSAGRRFQWREVCQFGIQICGALKHAHDHGIIHRDIKPANLLLTQDEVVKLSDFGIAKLFGNTQITVDGGVLGTADYMSPEQADGIGATSHSDLYSLGAVLYCLLTGRPPFVGKSMAEVIHKVLYDKPPSVLRLAAETPQELDQVIQQLLSKEPSQRVPTARALSNRLSAIQHALTLRERLNQDPVLHLEAEEAGTLRNDPDFDEARFANQETVAGLPIPEPDATDSQREIRFPGNPAVVKPSVASLPVDSRPPESHFVQVDPSDRRRHLHVESATEEPLAIRLAKIGLLVTMLALIGGLIWQLRKPPTADRLFQRIEVAAESGNDGLLRNEKTIVQFLARFPDDPRCQQVAEYRDEIELARLERQLEVTSRLRNASRSLAPVEQALVDAIRKETLNPDVAAKELEAIIEVFSSDGEATDREKQCIRLAERNLSRLQSRLQRNADTYVGVLRERIAFAIMHRKDRPRESRHILEGIIQLYADKPWAQEVVSEAHQQLQMTRGSDETALRNDADEHYP